MLKRAIFWTTPLLLILALLYSIRADISPYARRLVSAEWRLFESDPLPVDVIRQIYDMGVVDVITPDGTGEAAIYSYIRKHAKSANGRRAFERARTEIAPITRRELMQVVEIWADAALGLQDRDLRMMERLVRAQQRTTEAAPIASGPNVVPMRIAGTVN